MRNRKGNIPQAATGEIYQTESGWTLYRLSTGAEPWLGLKLIHLETIKGSANYWLSWNTEQKRFAVNNQLFRFKAHQPELYVEIQQVMNELYPTLTEEELIIK